MSKNELVGAGVKHRGVRTGYTRWAEELVHKISGALLHPNTREVVPLIAPIAFVSQMNQ